MTIELSPKLEKLVKEKAADSAFNTPDAFVAHVLEQALGLNGPPREQAEEPAPQADIWEAFEQLREHAAPEAREALNHLPPDLAAEHDHYIYGIPKKHP